MRAGSRLAADAFAEIRREMELAHCKWDAQIGDVTTLADFPILLGAAEWAELVESAEQLTAETLAVERELFRRPELWAELALPRRLRRLFSGARMPTPAAARVMRFDFHRTPEGWRVSEVNSDVPGGYTEATSFTGLVARHFGKAKTCGDPTAAVVRSVAATVGARGRVALVTAAGHMEDHQVVAYLAKALTACGCRAEVVSINQLARCDPDAIVRFYQAEWLAEIRGTAQLFVDGEVPVVNPGTAALTESKRLPLVWDRLATAVPTWRRLLPETRPLGLRLPPGWLAKDAYCNTGDTVSAKPGLRLRRGAWIAQRRFENVPVEVDDALFDACIGVYTVDGKAAGAYGRVVPHGKFIDAFARDVAVLVEEAS